LYFKSETYQAEQRGRIGIVVSHEWYEPMSNSTADKLATERARSFTFNWYSSPLNFNIVACYDNQHAFIPFAFDTFGFLAPKDIVAFSIDSLKV